MKYITLTLLFLMALAGCSKEEHKESVADLLGPISAHATKSKGEKSPEPGTTASTPVAGPAGASNEQSKASKIVYSKNEYGISRQVAIKEFKQAHYYESIVSEVEGFRSHFYHDNIGNAIGNGWNASFQSKRDNTDWAVTAGIPADMVIKIAALSHTSNNPNQPVPRDVVITPEQATSVANSMRPSFQKYVEKFVGAAAWSKLNENQKAVLAYHVEKVGPGGAAQYKGLYAAVRAYAANPTIENAKAAAAHIDYSYKLNGQVMHDHRSQLYMSALFVDPKAYGYLLGTTAAPANFKEIASVANMNIDPSKPAEGQIQSQDDFVKAKDEAFSRGQQLDIQPMLDGRPLKIGPVENKYIETNRNANASAQYM
jgi:hypothetical protein